MVMAAAPVTSGTVSYVVIVNRSSAMVKSTKRELAQIFLKKISRVNDTEVLPVDLVQSDPIRADFSKIVLDKSVAAVNAYWQQQIFSGKSVPPAEMSEDDAVAFVRSNPAGIAYVPLQKVGAGVKVIEIAD